MLYSDIKILIITNKGDITTDFIVKSLSSKKVPYYRLNTEEIGISLLVNIDFAENQFSIIDKNLDVEIDLIKITSVYFRRPEISQFGKKMSLGESNFIRNELIFTLEGLYRILANAYWLNNVYDIRSAENKIYQLLVAKNIGFQIPPSVITNNSKVAFDFYYKHKASCIIKPIKSGIVEGDIEEGVIFTSQVLFDNDNLQRIEMCPVYLQKLIQKRGDIRITIVADEVFPAFIHSQEMAESKIDWRKSSIPLEHSPIEVPENILTKCLELTNYFKLNFAAIDFILDEEGNYIFLEINPNGQWAWIERQLNYGISEKITSILIEKSIN